MMYVEQYAQQRMNEQQAERESEWRRIAEHWHEDARTVRASKWAVVRLFDRMFARRRAIALAELPDGARPRQGETDDQTDTEAASVSDAPQPSLTEDEPIWPTGSAAGRFAERTDDAEEGAGSADLRDRQELAVTR